MAVKARPEPETKAPNVQLIRFPRSVPPIAARDWCQRSASRGRSRW
jgi:hypothetical protein